MTKELKLKDFSFFFIEILLCSIFFPITNQLIFAMINLVKKKQLKLVVLCAIFTNRRFIFEKKRSIIIVLVKVFIFLFCKTFFFIQPKTKAQKNHRLNWPNSCLSSLKTTFISHYSITLANFCSVRAF